MDYSGHLKFDLLQNLSSCVVDIVGLSSEWNLEVTIIVRIMRMVSEIHDYHEDKIWHSQSF